MAFEPGVFTDAAYNKAKITLQQILGPNTMGYGHLRQPAPIFACVAEKQNIRLGGEAAVLTDARRCEGLDVSWLNICDLDVSDTTVDCQLDGDELGALKKTYVNNQTFWKAVKIPDSQCKDVHSLEEKRALALAAIGASLDQELERRVVTFLEANADDLSGLTFPVGAIDGGDPTLWNIPAASLSADLFIDLETFATQLNLISPQIIDGNNFWALLKKAAAKMVAPGNNCCNTDALYSLLPICQNQKTVDQVTGEARTFLIDSSNVAYFNSVINRNTSPMLKGDKDNTSVWSMPSRTLRWKNGNTLLPVMYDIKFQYQCVSGNDYIQVFHGEHRGAFITGGTNCNERVGIVKIAATPAEE